MLMVWIVELWRFDAYFLARSSKKAKAGNGTHPQMMAAVALTGIAVSVANFRVFRFWAEVFFFLFSW